MAKGASKSAVEVLEDQEVSPVNTDDLDYALFEAERRVLEIQTKLHRWAENHLDSGTCGAPVAVKAARRVREAVRGNGPVERPEPRLGPTSLLRPRTRLRGVAVQCPARQERARPKDRPDRCGVVGRRGRPRDGPAQFRTAPADPGATRSHSLPEEAG